MSRINHSKTAEAVNPERKRKRNCRLASPSPDKLLAAKISARVKENEARVRSTIGIYSLKTKESSFGLPFCAVSDHFALLAQKQLLPISDCYKVATICLLDGKVVSCSRPVLVLDKGV